MNRKVCFAGNPSSATKRQGKSNYDRFEVVPGISASEKTFYHRLSNFPRLEVGFDEFLASLTP